MSGDHDLIESYLDELVLALGPLGPRRLRRVLAETEAHLWDAAEDAVRQGMNERDAQAQAIARFGPAPDLAEAERRAGMSGAAAHVLRQAISSGWLLGAIAGLAVGVSGLLAALVRVVFGGPILVDAAPNVVLSASDCARWLAGDPAARTCRDAAVSDWTAEVIGSRLAAGLLGLLAVLAYRRLRRRGWLAEGLPRTVTDTVAATGFAVGALLTLALGCDALLTAGGHGSGQWFSGSAAALAAALIFGWRLLADLRLETSQQALAVASGGAAESA
jgi:hypothetical protein